MEKSIFLAGSGGHGIQIAGKTLVQAMNTESINAAYSPRYGVEKRGGLSSCYLVISNGKIGNPRKPFHDLVVLMDQRSYGQFKDTVKDGGTLVINSTMVKADELVRKDCTQMELPLMQIAQQLGNPKVISSVLLGLLAGMPGLIKETERLKETMLKFMAKKPELLELNKRAFREGMSLAKSREINPGKE